MSGTDSLDCEVCFVVIKQHDGQIAIANLENAVTKRVAGPDDVYQICAHIMRDITVQETAATLVKAFQQIGNAPPMNKVPEPVAGQEAVAKPTSKFQKVTRA